MLKEYLPSHYLIDPQPGDLPGVIKNSAIKILQTFAPFIALAFFLTTLTSAWHARKKKKMLNKQTSLQSIAELNPREFEHLVGEAYRRKGFKVIENEGEGADGGVDLLLKRKGKTYIVQCKHYKSKNVGVPIIREMYGLLMGSSYAEAIVIVTSGNFSKEAIAFAKGKPMELVPGNDLLGLIKEGQKNSSINLDKKTSKEEIKQRRQEAKSQGEKLCPQCKKGHIIKRKTKKGKFKGKTFLGCTEFPRCKYVKY